MNSCKIRLIEPADCEAALTVYAPYVLHTPYTFECKVPSQEDFAAKIKKITAQYPWLVCTYNDKVIGYAYGSTHRDRTAYQWSPEATIYIAETFHGKGVAELLYRTLFQLLKLQGYYNIYAGVLVTNAKSVGFHKKMGFEEIGIFKNIGYKLGAWQSNLWLQYFLSDHESEPATPVAFPRLMNTDTVKMILEYTNLELTNRIQQ